MEPQEKQELAKFISDYQYHEHKSGNESYRSADCIAEAIGEFYFRKQAPQYKTAKLKVGPSTFYNQGAALQIEVHAILHQGVYFVGKQEGHPFEIFHQNDLTGYE